MEKSIEERVQASFHEEDREVVKQYLEWIRATLFDLAASIRRSATLLILLIAIYEFINSSRHASVTLAGFSISNGSVILILIPALVAYFYLEIVLDSTKVGRLQETLTRVFAQWSTKGEENDLDVLIMPSYPLFWSPGRAARSANQYETEKIADNVSGAFLWLVIVGAIAFQVQAYYDLFNALHSVGSYILWIVSLAVTVSCLTVIVYNLYLDLSEQ